MAPVKSINSQAQWRIPQDSRALCFQTGWSKEEARKLIIVQAWLRLEIFFDNRQIYIGLWALAPTQIPNTPTFVGLLDGFLI